MSGTVWALGFTSLFTDISSEMVTSVLPMYLVLQLGLTPFAFGVIDGLYHGVAALVRVAAGLTADRLRRHKELAAVGYALSAACRIGILAAGTAWGALSAIVAVDRIGKGLRTAPRDALISLRSPRCDLAVAFGVHRALDAMGAMLGPVVAFLLLASMPGRFDMLFVVSFGIALVGLGVLTLFVDAAPDGRAAPAPPVTARRALAVATAPRFRALLIVGFVLGLATISDGFIFLMLQRQLQVGAMAFPLFYVGASIFTALLAVPFGRAADRSGRLNILLVGYTMLAGVYATLFLPTATIVTVVCSLALLGGYYAATDGVLTAMAAADLSPSATATGLALLATATNVSRLIASTVFGLMWTVIGAGQATAVYGVALLLAIVASGIILLRAASTRLASND